MKNDWIGYDQLKTTDEKLKWILNNDPLGLLDDRSDDDGANQNEQGDTK